MTIELRGSALPAVHRLSADASGDAAGGARVTAVLAHGTGFHGRVWAPVARRLPGVDCLAPDLRGHGESRVPDGYEFPWSAFGDDLLATVDRVDPAERGPVVGIGHSCGAAALVLAEVARPGTFAALWLYEPAAFPPPPAGVVPSNPLAASARRRRATFAGRAEAARNYASKPPMNAFDPEALAAFVDHGFDDVDDHVRLKCLPANEAQVYESALVAEVFAAMARVRCPVVVVEGGESKSGRFARLAAQFPDGRLETHPDLTHNGPLTHPDRIAASILDWLAPLR